MIEQTLFLARFEMDLVDSKVLADFERTLLDQGCTPTEVAAAMQAKRDQIQAEKNVALAELRALLMRGDAPLH